MPDVRTSVDPIRGLSCYRREGGFWRELRGRSLHRQTISGVHQVALSRPSYPRDERPLRTDLALQGDLPEPSDRRSLLQPAGGSDAGEQEHKAKLNRPTALLAGRQRRIRFNRSRKTSKGTRDHTQGSPHSDKWDTSTLTAIPMGLEMSLRHYT